MLFESPGGAFISQFKNWLIPLFFAVPRKAKNASESRTGHQKSNSTAGGVAFFAVRGSNYVRTCRWHVHESVRTLTNTLICAVPRKAKNASESRTGHFYFFPARRPARRQGVPYGSLLLLPREAARPQAGSLSRDSNAVRKPRWRLSSAGSKTG